jgi:PIN domain nuclease of toxin-antitoxin system
VSKLLLDASALLASFKREPGAEAVNEAMLAGAIVSAVNWSEALAKLVEIGFPQPIAEQELLALPLGILAFEYRHARLCAELREPTRKAGLSFADRACLATAKLENVRVLTADRAWARLDLGVDIRVIR